MKFFLFPVFLISTLMAFSQEADSVVYEEPVFVEEESNDIEETFLSTRVVNGHSVETLRKGTLEFRVEHKFGDAAGADGGIHTLYGLDNATDIRIGFEYGVSDNFMIGFGRCRGAIAPNKSLLDGFLKYRILRQKRKGMPISLSAVGTSTYTYMKRSTIATDVAYFSNNGKLNDLYRFAYSAQLNFARKFGKKLTLAVMPTLTWRNYVAADDQNLLFSLGSSVTYFVNTKTSISLEYYNNFNEFNMRTGFKNSLSVSVDWMTFGHNFKVFFTNSAGIGETQFINYTDSDWLKGQFRIGFCIGRKYMKE